MDERFEKIAALENEIQAALLDAELADRGIPHAMHSYHSRILDGVFQLTAGWGHVEAPAEFRETILAILGELDEVSSDDDPAEDLDDESFEEPI